jgi:hypothetical protein
VTLALGSDCLADIAPLHDQRCVFGRSPPIRTDTAGGTQASLDYLTAHMRSYSVGFGLSEGMIAA